MKRRLFDPEHQAFRDTFRTFVEREIAPSYSTWERNRIVARDAWTSAGAQGFLCLDVPERYGGSGVTDFRYNLIITEELGRVGAVGVGYPLHTDIVVPYLTRYGTEAQKNGGCRRPFRESASRPLRCRSRQPAATSRESRRPRSVAAITTFSTVKRRSSATASSTIS